MIVVDTNTLAYLYLPTTQTDDVVALLHKDPAWAAPLLWRSEFRNVLVAYIKRGSIDADTALAIQLQAEQQMAEREYSVNSRDVLTLAAETGCSAYDCEFVSLAISLGVKLITSDKKIIKHFPETAITAGAYLGM
jgi:predicted nucleic acid-binding protein